MIRIMSQVFIEWVNNQYFDLFDNFSVVFVKLYDIFVCCVLMSLLVWMGTLFPKSLTNKMKTYLLDSMIYH